MGRLIDSRVIDRADRGLAAGASGTGSSGCAGA